MANKPLKTIKFPGLDDTYTIPQVDAALATSGAAADAKKVGDELTNLKQDLGELDVYTLGLYPQMSVEDTAVASFTDGADDIPVKSLTVDITPVQSGSGDPSPENVRPISGWTGANVSVVAVNVWDEKWEVGGIDGTTGQNINGNDRIRSKNYIPIVPGAPYYWGYFDSKEMSFYICEYDANKNFIQRTQKTKNAVYSFDCAYVRFFVYAIGGMTTYSNDISINYPSTDHDYHAYKGNVYSITFPTSAGTVYGGTLDVTNGVLTVDKAIISKAWGEWTLDGTLTNYTRKKQALSNKCATNAGVSTDKLCNIAPYLSNWTSDTLHFYAEPEGAYVFLPHDTASDVVVQVVYPLLVPLTYQLTPTEVSTILGQNNIFCDTGDIAELTYRADLKAYIDAHVGS